MLENKYGEYEALENTRILMERMNVTTQEEIDAIIKKDMDDFVTYTESKMNESIGNYYEFYTGFESWFDTFFAGYTQNLKELAELNREFLELLNIEDYLDGNAMNIEGEGLGGPLGTLSAKDQAILYSKVDMDENYAARMDEAIKDGDFAKAREWALLREAKANLSEKIVLGQGNYKTNEQVWQEAMAKYYGEATEEITDKLNENQIVVDKNAQYTLNNGNTLNKGNALIQGQTIQLSGNLTDVQKEIISQAGYTVEAINELARTLSVSMEAIISSIEAGGSGWVDGTDMTKDELAEALANGQYVDLGGGVYLDPNKKAPVYNNANEDPGVVGSDAWYKSQGIGMSAQSGANTNYSKANNSNSKTGTYDKYTDYSAAYQNANSDSERAAIEKARDEKIKNEYGGVDPNPNWNKGYATGIKKGPVTYTGLAMLHGTPQEPEYVLNNDQAYNLLYNLSASRNAKMAEFDRVKTSDSGIQYVVQGDIILEGVDDPADFWQEVTNAMGNRWNVTKNR